MLDTHAGPAPRMKSPFAIVVLLFVALASCRTPRSQVIVLIEQDPDTPLLLPLQAVRVQLFSEPGGAGHSQTNQYPAELPIDFSVYPENEAVDHRARVIVDACGASGCDQPLVRQTAVFGFVRGEARLLRIRLSSRCAGIRCGADQTCAPESGLCVDARVEAASLPSFVTDAGTNSDAGDRRRAVQIANGGGYSCIRTADHTVFCWGGEARVAPYTSTPAEAHGSTPVEVTGARGAIDLSVGGGHACAILADRSVVCWGRNDVGQVGDGTQTDASNPVPVTGVRDVIGLALGARASCALRRGGSVACWGEMEPYATDAFTPQLQPTVVDGVSNVVSLAVGTYHACATRADGTVACWGASLGGQFGDGDAEWGGTMSPPTMVAGLDHVTSVAAGAFHTCARRDDGSVWCWGWNDSGQLGYAPSPQIAAPRPVPGLADTIDVHVGMYFTCARTSRGEVRCFGANEAGQLGDGTTHDRDTPVATIGLEGVRELSLGAEHACVISHEGAVRCWGSDTGGQTGSGRALRSATPVRVDATNPRSVSSGSGETCAIDDDVVRCWGLTFGYGFRGVLRPVRSSTLAGSPLLVQSYLQDGPRIATSNPTPVLGLDAPSAQVVTTESSTLVRLRDGSIRAWGAGVNGLLGDGRSVSSEQAVTVSGIRDAVELAASNTTACARHADGTVSCWGDNRIGTVDGTPRSGSGQSRSDPIAIPVSVEGIRGATALGLSGETSCAVREDRTMRCWGRNLGESAIGFLDVPEVMDIDGTGSSSIYFNWAHATSGSLFAWGYKLGRAGDDDDPAVRPAAGLLPGFQFTYVPRAVELAGGRRHVCARDDSGSVACWGANDTNQTGTGSFATLTPAQQPVRVALGSRARSLAAGDDFTCALEDSGAIQCWGRNDVGQLGAGNMAPSMRVETPFATGAVGLAARARHACAATSDGAIACWGSDEFGEAGDAPIVTHAPARVALSGRAIDLATAWGTSCAVTEDGQVWCWGSNEHGALGTGAGDIAHAPTNVPSVSAATRVAVGGSHACAITTSGEVWCWGSNTRGQLGNGTLGGVSGAASVTGVSGAVQIELGLEHSCARTSTGAVYCWGENASGQLGDGTTVDRAQPVQVTLPARATDLACTTDSTCAVLENGSVMCWGYNGSAELGNNRRTDRETRPQLVVDADASPVVAISAGRDGYCATHAIVGGHAGTSCWGNTREIVGVAAGTTVPALEDAIETGIGGGYVGSFVDGGRIGPDTAYLCALRMDGEVRCHGSNARGELGDGTVQAREEPVSVVGVHGAVQLRVNGWSACARTASGDVFCWGANDTGQCGDGRALAQPRPTAVPGFGSGAGVASVSVGAGYACALMGSARASTVRCWGSGPFSRLGTGPNIDDRTEPSELFTVENLANVASIDVGDDHACALVAGQRAACWGRAERGESGTTVEEPRGYQQGSAVFVLPPSTAVAAGGRHTCVLDPNGAALCIGANEHGQCGGRAGDDVVLSTATLIGNGASAIATGGAHTCIVANGNVRCFGSNERGQLGDGTTTSRGNLSGGSVITRVVGIAASRDYRCDYDPASFVRCAASGQDHTCVVDRDGAVFCWGRNDRGQLGDGTTEDRATPVQVMGLPGPVDSVTAGGTHTCAVVRATGRRSLYCWGDNTYGELGQGDAVNVLVPSPIVSVR